MKRFRFAWLLLLFFVVYCSSPAQVCPDPQLFVDGACVDLCDDVECDDSNDCTFEECQVNEQDLTASCIPTDVADGRDCDAEDGSRGVCMTG